MNQHLQKIISFCELHDITIISYGLAPNPFGFCYEAGDRTCASDCEYLDNLLDELSPKDEQILRQLIFGAKE